MIIEKYEPEHRGALRALKDRKQIREGLHHTLLTQSCECKFAITLLNVYLNSGIRPSALACPPHAFAMRSVAAQQDVLNQVSVPVPKLLNSVSC